MRNSCKEADHVNPKILAFSFSFVFLAIEYEKGILNDLVLIQTEVWRRGGLMVSTLEVRSEGRWFKSGFCRFVVSLDKKLYSTLSIFTQVYKWVLAIIMLGGNLVMG